MKTPSIRSEEKEGGHEEGDGLEVLPWCEDVDWPRHGLCTGKSIRFRLIHRARVSNPRAVLARDCSLGLLNALTVHLERVSKGNAVRKCTGWKTFEDSNPVSISFVSKLLTSTNPTQLSAICKHRDGKRRNVERRNATNTKRNETNAKQCDVRALETQKNRLRRCQYR